MEEPSEKTNMRRRHIQLKTLSRRNPHHSVREKCEVTQSTILGTTVIGLVSFYFLLTV
ncbi:hypothetical protein PIB30_046158 [Stylosanthes scabra]|uniref:Uncharacterized protein n=1 Tax=Stylosanthes scabra TaxID=79078 RepID=A0ABU6UGL7_9FABA|nr:hypothetical protein [Stylosanthes scabra]